MAVAEASQWVEETTPNAPSSSGRVVNMGGNPWSGAAAIKTADTAGVKGACR